MYLKVGTYSNEHTCNPKTWGRRTGVQETACATRPCPLPHSTPPKQKRKKTTQDIKIKINSLSKIGQTGQDVSGSKGTCHLSRVWAQDPYSSRRELSSKAGPAHTHTLTHVHDINENWAKEAGAEAADIHLLSLSSGPPQAVLIGKLYKPSLPPSLKGKAVSLFPTFLGT